MERFLFSVFKICNLTKPKIYFSLIENLSLAVYVMLIIFLQEVTVVIFAYFPPEIGRKITIFSLDRKQNILKRKKNAGRH